MKSLSQFISESSKISISNEDDYNSFLKEWKMLKKAAINHKLIQRDAKRINQLNRALNDYEEKHNIERDWKSIFGKYRIQ